MIALIAPIAIKYGLMGAAALFSYLGHRKAKQIHAAITKQGQ